MPHRSRTTPIGITATVRSEHDSAGVFRAVSPECSEVLGYRPGDLIGHSFYEFVHPDDQHTVQVAHGEMLEGETSVSFEFRLRCADGSYREVRTTTHLGGGVRLAMTEPIPDTASR